MGYARENVDESRFSPARKLAWEIVFPYRNIPVIGFDESQAKAVEQRLLALFTVEQLEEAASRVKP